MQTTYRVTGGGLDSPVTIPDAHAAETLSEMGYRVTAATGAEA